MKVYTVLVYMIGMKEDYLHPIFVKGDN